MPTIINADTATGGAIITGDGSGVLQLQSGGVTGLTVTGANVTTAGNLTVTGSFSSTAGLTSPVTVAGNSTAGAEIRLPEDTDNGSNYVALKAPNSLASNLTFTLPTADGSNGQYLQTNGSGQLAFATVPTTSPAGSTGQIQINSSGSFGALSSGTNGQIIVSQGSGNPPTFLAQGSSGQVLTSQGSGSAPTWAAPSSGLVLLGTFTASGATTLNVDSGGSFFTSTYDRYLLQLIGFSIPANQSLSLRMYISGSLISSANYGSQAGYYASGAWNNYASSFNQSNGSVGYFSGQNIDPFSINMIIDRPSVNGINKTIYFDGTAGGSGYAYPIVGGIGLSGNTGPLTGLQFFFGSGNAFSGTARLYGFSK